jgi:two-component system, chemotaxis family, CheB/CheR fusion protein
VKQNLQDILEEKNVVIESTSLPVLEVVPLQFQQLFSNLISNSVKYGKTNVPPRIKIKAQVVNGEEVKATDPTSKYWKISFADNGIRFQQQHAEKIFELFQRLHGKQEYSGTGIGLVICKKIVQNHHGFITAEGYPNIGATMNIYLPLHE